MKKSFNMQETTEGERNQLIEMLAETMKDMIYANADERAKQFIKSLFVISEIKDEDSIDMTYNIKMSGGTLRAFLGKIRRKKVKK